MRRCVIIGGAPIENYEKVRSYLDPEDFIIACDCGLRHIESLHIRPNLIVGDFDSYERPDSEIDTIVLPTVKDDTDTVHAMNVALERGYDNFLLVGMTGRRLDHTLGNIYMLVKLFELGKTAVIIDDYAEISVVGKETVYIDDSLPFFSLLNITGTAKGITIRNAKYPLDNAEIRYDYQYGISNEVLPGQTAEVSVSDGLLLLTKDYIG